MKKVDWKGNTEGDLPTIPNPEWKPRLLETTGAGRARMTWFLVDEADKTLPPVRMMLLKELNGIQSWRKQAVRTPKQGAERNALILTAAVPLLSPTEPMTLRHLFYLLVGLQVVENCNADYQILSKLTSDARVDGTIDDESIADEHRTVYKRLGYDTIAAWAHLEETTYHKNLWTSQDDYVECWFEKGAVMSTVERLHREYQVTMRPFKGQASRAYCAEIARDFSSVEGKQITVYYFGDHDPSGYAIPRSGETRVREILNADYEGSNANFAFVRLGFNSPPIAFPCDPNEDCPVCSTNYTVGDHFAEHNLPSWDVESKIGDGNYKWFVTHFGDRCAELDAIPPDELRAMVRDAITSHITHPDAWYAVADIEALERAKIKKALSRLH